MNLHAQKKTPEQLVEAVFALDLDPIKFKLMDPREGQGWTRAEADRLELEYKRFLALVAKFPEETIVPDTDVDKFWHMHILDTMKYAEDCQNVFGYFLHHFPYFGMRDAEDAANLANAASTTRSLYLQAFGAAGQAESAYCAAAAGSYCAAMSDKVVSAYCAATSGNTASAYCARVAASYCAVAGGQDRQALDKTTAYCAVVTGKGRPTLDSDGVSQTRQPLTSIAASR